MKYKICAVKNCRETDPLVTSRSFHHFPKNPKYNKNWTARIPYLKTGDVVCDRHFTTDNYDYRKVKLNNNAFPTLFLEIDPPPPPPEPVVQQRCFVKYCERVVETLGIDKDSRCFHPFPTKKQMRDLWLEAIGLESPKELRNGSVVCSRHFTISDYSTTQLKVTAVPSQNLPRMLPINKQKCCIKNCAETDPLYENRSFHHFPKNLERRKKWLELLKLDASSVKITALRICDRHFTAKDYSYTDRLVSTSMPSKDLEIPDLTIEEEMKLCLAPNPPVATKSKELEQNMLLDRYTALLTKNNELKNCIEEIKSQNLELKLFIERYK